MRDGVYEVFMKTTSYLQTDVGQMTIQSHEVTNISYLPDKPLLACDLNNDNIVNILDIEQINNDLRSGKSKDGFSDIDRNGRVDIFDRNYCVNNFLKEGDTP